MAQAPAPAPATDAPVPLVDKTQPIALKFTAADGTKIDLAALHGKVVLLYFWASWSGTCRQEFPDAVAAYNKYHSQGLEIIGMSFDMDKNAMFAFKKENKMVWPEYFDGEGARSKVIKPFDIKTIPGTWLLDKNGMVITTDCGDDLDGQIEKALKTP